jgi:hypothetical protein
MNRAGGQTGVPGVWVTMGVAGQRRARRAGVVSQHAGACARVALGGWGEAASVGQCARVLAVLVLAPAGGPGQRSGATNVLTSAAERTRARQRRRSAPAQLR